ncbi:MAG: L-2-amino-thiazoline-4-carboxylic acid hydrolase [Bifidobacteriaceae bacterium]|nr:L-2-amino-thiazoline-4-carboxylic acid hydrolase [Bifidobacteriaceae bacterium]
MEAENAVEAEDAVEEVGAMQAKPGEPGGGGAAAPGVAEIGILARREIEAGVIGPIYKILVREVGADKARQIIAEAVVADARRAGAEASAGVAPEGRMRRFIEIQERWTRGGALVTQHTEESETAFAYTVSHCAYADMYRRLGLAELGPVLSCLRDAAFAEGFDPRMRLDRPQTIMRGAPLCQFRYTLAPN